MSNDRCALDALSVPYTNRLIILGRRNDFTTTSCPQTVMMRSSLRSLCIVFPSPSANRLGSVRMNCSKYANSGAITMVCLAVMFCVQARSEDISELDASVFVCETG